MSDLLLPENNEMGDGDRSVSVKCKRQVPQVKFSALPGKDRALVTLILSGFLKSQFSSLKDEIRKNLTLDDLLECVNDGTVTIQPYQDGTFSLFHFKEKSEQYEELANFTIKMQ